MTFVMIRHRVEDYEKWRVVFDAHESTRTAFGIKEKYVWHTIDDKNEVTVLFEVADIEKSKEFLELPELKEAMQEAGVLTKLDIYFLEE